MSALPNPVDRYRSFKGIDFDGQSRRMLERIELENECF